MIGFFNISHPCVDAEVQLVCKYFRARTGSKFMLLSFFSVTTCVNTIIL